MEIQRWMDRQIKWSTPMKDTEYSKKKPGAPKGNKNAVNNRGGAKKGNKMLSVIPEDLLHCVMVMLLVMVYIESIYRKKYMI